MKMERWLSSYDCSRGWQILQDYACTVQIQTWAKWFIQNYLQNLTMKGPRTHFQLGDKCVQCTDNNFHMLYHHWDNSLPSHSHIMVHCWNLDICHLPVFLVHNIKLREYMDFPGDSSWLHNWTCRGSHTFYISHLLSNSLPHQNSTFLLKKVICNIILLHSKREHLLYYTISSLTSDLKKQ